MVIGGGVVGLTIARRLALDGLSVTLLERGVIGAEASWAGAGILAPLNPHRRDAMFEFQQRSLGLYEPLCVELAAETGIDPEFDRCGELQLLFDDQAVRIASSDARAGSDLQTAAGQPAYQTHTAAEAVRIEPKVIPEAVGALECRTAAQVRNPRLLRALKTSCERLGVRILERTPVEDWLIERDRVGGVQTPEGVLSAGFYVLCAGAWSSHIGERLQTLMPVHPVKGQIVLLKLPERLFQRIISHARTYLVPRRDGHVVLGSTEEPEAGFSKRTTAQSVAHLLQNALRLVPSLSEALIEDMWCGLRPGTPDEKPYIGPVPGLSGLFAATGHYRNGLTLAPATAEAISDMVRGVSYDIDLSSCAPARGRAGR